MMMMIVDLYSALRRAPLLRYVSQCIVKRNVFSADRTDPMLSDRSRWSGSRFQTIGPATTYCDDDMVRSADGEWQIGDTDDSTNAAVDVKPRWNFRVLVTTRAAAFITRWSLSVMFFGDLANMALQLLHKAEDDAVKWLESTATIAFATWNELFPQLFLVVLPPYFTAPIPVQNSSLYVCLSHLWVLRKWCKMLCSIP